MPHQFRRSPFSGFERLLVRLPTKNRSTPAAPFAALHWPRAADGGDPQGRKPEGVEGGTDDDGGRGPEMLNDICIARCAGEGLWLRYRRLVRAQIVRREDGALRNKTGFLEMMRRRANWAYYMDRCFSSWLVSSCPLSPNARPRQWASRLCLPPLSQLDRSCVP